MCKFRLYLLILFLLQTSVVAKYKEYIVQNGDNLSNILYENVSGRIYGQKGNLADTIRLNPHIKDMNHIEVNTKILILDTPYSQADEDNKRKLAQVIDTEEEVDATLKSENDAKIKDSEPNKEKASNNYRYGLGLGFNTESITAIDLENTASDTAVSEISPYLHYSISNQLNEKFTLRLVGSISKTKFKIATNKTIEDDNLLKFYTGIDILHLVSEKLAISYGIGMGDSFLLTATSKTTIDIKKASLIAASLNSSYSLMKFDSGYTINLNTRFGLLLPSTQEDYETELGNFWKVGFSSTLANDTEPIGISIGYGNRTLKTQYIEQTNKNIDLSVSFGF